MQPSHVSIPEAPREPSARARELIFRYQGAQLVFLILGLAFSAAGIIVTLAVAGPSFGDVALAVSKQMADGRVTGSHIDYHTRINGQHPTRIAFSFTADGVEHSGDSGTRDPAIIQAATAGATVRVEYVGWNPGWARVEGTSYSALGMFGLIFLIFPLLGVTFTTIAVRSNRREIRAFRHGSPITARVTFAGPDTRTRINGRNPFKVEWQFQVDGKPYTGSISSMKTALLDGIRDKQQIIVLYDPANPNINTCWAD